MLLEMVIFVFLVILIVSVSFSIGFYSATNKIIVSKAELLLDFLNKLIKLGYIRTIIVEDENGQPVTKLVRYDYGEKTSSSEKN